MEFYTNIQSKTIPTKKCYIEPTQVAKKMCHIKLLQVHVIHKEDIVILGTTLKQQFMCAGIILE